NRARGPQPALHLPDRPEQPRMVRRDFHPLNEPILARELAELSPHEPVNQPRTSQPGPVRSPSCEPWLTSLRLAQLPPETYSTILVSSVSGARDSCYAAASITG